MASIVRLGRLMAALGLTLGSASIMTPIWLIRAIFLRGRGRTKKTAEWPNVLQFWLTSSARMLLGWQARLGVQPALYTRTPYSFENKIAGCSSFEWIQPAGSRQSGGSTGGGKAGFDDSSLPVRLSSAEWKKKTAGLWYRNKRDASPLHKRDSPVVLYFHGGAYITLDAGDAFMGLVCARNQSWYAQVDILSVAYRLAPGSKYPSQLYEAYSAFCHLKKKGYKKIFIGGDSAGANLAATLWKYLDEVTDEAADSVAGLLLFSPWLDMYGSKRAAFQQQISSCAVSPAYVETGFASLQTNGLPRASDPWISPVQWSANTMKKLPSLFVTHGGEETLVEEGMEFVGKARASGVDVHHFIKDGFPHDFQCLPWFPSAIQEVFTAQGEFIRERTVMA